MSISNDPLRSSTTLSQLSGTRPQTQTTQTTSTKIESPPETTPPSTGVSKPESFTPRTTEISTVPNQELQKKVENRVDQVSEVELQEVSQVIPKPQRMLQPGSVFSAPPEAPPLPEKAVALSKAVIGQDLIRPNFTKLCKELDRSIFGKDKVLHKAQERAKTMAELTPPGSDLMLTFANASDDQLREMVAHGIALTKPGKYNPENGYAGLSHNKQRMVDAIVAGIREGMPETLKSLHKVEERGTLEQVQTRVSLNDQIRNAPRKTYTEEDIQVLDQYVASKGIEQIRAKMQLDTEALRTEVTYRDLPIPDPSETSLDVLGPMALRNLMLTQNDLKAKTLEALDQVPETDRKGLLWTLSMKPFNETCDEVSQQLYAKPFSELSESESTAVKNLSQTLVVASLEKLGPGEGNSLVRSGQDGPQEITHNGKTYDQVRQLGEGGFGVAYLFKERGGDDEVVVKRFKQDKQSDESWFGAMQDEIRTHRYAMGPEGQGHDNVLGLRGIITRPPQGNEHFGEIFTLTEVAKGGELRGVMKNMHKELQEGRISKTVHELLNRQLFAQTIEGMHYIQRDRQMLHLDLKPENLFMTEDGTVKVGDFGLANIGHETKATTGTMVYLSPEMVSGGDKKVDYHSDTWTLGIIGRELFTGTRALTEGDIVPKKDAPSFRPMILLNEFGSDTDNRIYHSSQEEGATPTKFEGHDGVERPLQNLGSFHQLINAMQHPDPKQRPSLDVVRQHEFVSDPILSAEPVQQLLGMMCQPVKGLNEEQLKARHTEMARLNTEIENLLKH